VPQPAAGVAGLDDQAVLAAAANQNSLSGSTNGLGRAETLASPAPPASPASVACSGANRRIRNLCSATTAPPTSR